MICLSQVFQGWHVFWEIALGDLQVPQEVPKSEVLWWHKQPQWSNFMLRLNNNSKSPRTYVSQFRLLFTDAL